MTPPAPRPSVSPELRASLFHSTVFMSNGILSAYFPVWLSSRGLSAEQIGIVNAVPILCVLLGSVFIGRLADRASDWRVMITILAAICALASFGLITANGFLAILFVFTLCNTPATALMPILDAATLNMTQRHGTHFAAIRVWGSVGYVAAAALGGVIIGWLGAVAFVPLFIATCALRAGLAFQLPRFRGPATPAVTAPSKSGLRDLLKLWFLLPCIAYALIGATHYFLGFMAALIWQADGIPVGWFGPLIAYSAASEVLVMFLWPRLNLKMSARMMLIIAGAVAIVRYVGMAMNPSLPVLFALQTLHGITYPLSYFGLVHFVANWAHEHHAAEAQSFAFMLSQGFAVVTFLTFGMLVSAIGGGSFLVAAGMCAVAVGLTLVSIRLMPIHARSLAASVAH